jgi:hypothetical protein
MTDIIRLGRPFFVLLALALAGRWIMGARGVPYERGHHVFSITAITVMAAIFYALFCRRWRGYRAVDAMAMGAAFGLTAQMAIFVSTAVSYALGLETYFNHPAALNAAGPVPFEQALVSRAVGLLVGPVIDAVVALLGWVLAPLLPAAIVPHTPDTAA